MGRQASLKYVIMSRHERQIGCRMVGKDKFISEMCGVDCVQPIDETTSSFVLFEVALWAVKSNSGLRHIV